MSELDNINSLITNALKKIKNGDIDSALEEIILAKYVNKYEPELYKILSKIFILKNKNLEALKNILIYYNLLRVKIIDDSNLKDINEKLTNSKYEKFFWRKEIYSGLKIDLTKLPDLKKFLFQFSDIISNPETAYFAGLSYLSANRNVLDHNNIEQSIFSDIKKKLAEDIEGDIIIDSDLSHLTCLIGLLLIIINYNLFLNSQEVVLNYFTNEEALISTNIRSAVLFFGKNQYFLESFIQYGFEEYEKENINSANEIAGDILLIDENHAKAMFLRGKCLYHKIGFPELHRLNKLGNDNLKSMLDVFNQMTKIDGHKTEVQTAIRYLTMAAKRDMNLMEEAYKIISDMEDLAYD